MQLTLLEGSESRFCILSTNRATTTGTFFASFALDSVVVVAKAKVSDVWLLLLNRSLFLV